MKAVICTKYGPPEVLKIKDIEKPVPKDNEVLVKVHAAIVSPPDCAFRKAEPFIVRFFAGFFKPKNPVPGELFSGVVEAVGKDVTKFKAGDEIFGSTGMKLGAYAEYATVIESEMLVKKPETMSHKDAAGIGDGPITSLPFLRDNAKLEKGQKILINGASGSVGIAGVQLAKQMGAEVTAVCGSSNVERMKELGADHVIDYTKEDFTKKNSCCHSREDGNLDPQSELRMTQGLYDVIFDAVGKSSFSACKNVLTYSGKYLTTIPTLSVMIKMLLTSKSKGKKVIFAATGIRKPEDKTKDLITLRDMIVDGTLKSVVDKTYSLDEIVDAHTYVETGHKKGNVVVRIEG